MLRLIAISGSLRRHSFNTALLRAAQASAPDDVRLELCPIGDFPLYNNDLENERGVPAVVEDLKEKLAQADGLLISTPEYNNSMPGVLKNAIDWLSRPPRDIDRVFAGLPVAIIGASAGGFGTVLAQAAWLPVLRTLGMQHWSGGRLLVSKGSDVFDATDTLVDDAIRTRLARFVAGFAEFIEAAPRRH
jgi:chromate reductase, NAD(P)H dehydrogenase (quinone)